MIAQRAEHQTAATARQLFPERQEQSDPGPAEVFGLDEIDDDASFTLGQQLVDRSLQILKIVGVDASARLENHDAGVSLDSNIHGQAPPSIPILLES
jgi:hypothetical protein